MTFNTRIRADLEGAMRGGNVLVRDTLRMVLAALENRRIEVGDDLDEAAELAVLATAAKTRAESARQYDEAGRPELAAQERAEIEVITAYLPRQLSEDEVRGVVEAKVKDLGLTAKSEMGKLMKAVMADHKGEVDGKLVQRIAGELLS